ncbi:hypothetical protein F5B20DRAFT_542392 [Whalleya microplaca]|nr:hypothetical protein F5B20DRAFT_542392 [Whalleya microplaca]
MRLMNTSTLALKEFYGTDVPRYAILSHTWETNEEVTFREWNSLSESPQSTGVRMKKGYGKIIAACQEAQRQHLDYIWCDTNCIDKSSSAELSEAINSMFSWYQRSAICFVYLADVPFLPSKDGKLGAEFERSKWFTRGWTLQELLAPDEVFFYSADWKLLGIRYYISQQISAITNIDKKYIRHANIRDASIAEKMSWVSRRVTTRPEDLSYCMLGIFDVNMPLLYGEGSRAFVRLQEEIIRRTNDHTIFCWSADVQSLNHSDHGSIPVLALHPIAFSDSGAIREVDKRNWRDSSYSMTNAGLRIQMPLIRAGNGFYGVLDTIRDSDILPKGYQPTDTRLCIPLHGSQNAGVFHRSSIPEKPIILNKSWVHLVSSGDIYIPPIGRGIRYSGRLHQDYLQPCQYGASLVFKHSSSEHKPNPVRNYIEALPYRHIDVFSNVGILSHFSVYWHGNTIVRLTKTSIDNVYGAITRVGHDYVVFLATLHDPHTKIQSDTWTAEVIYIKELNNRADLLWNLWEHFKSRVTRHEFGVHYDPSATVKVELGWMQHMERVRNFMPVYIREE